MSGTGIQLPLELVADIFSFVSDEETVKSLENIGPFSKDLAVKYCCSRIKKVTLQVKDRSYRNNQSQKLEVILTIDEYEPLLWERESWGHIPIDRLGIEEWFQTIIKRAKSLQTLDICICSLPDLGDNYRFVEAFQPHNSLRRLNLEFYSHFRYGRNPENPPLVELLVCALQNFSNIRYLGIGQEVLKRIIYQVEETEELSRLADAVAALQSLEDFSFRSCYCEPLIDGMDTYARSDKQSGTLYLAEPDRVVHRNARRNMITSWMKIMQLLGEKNPAQFSPSLFTKLEMNRDNDDMAPLEYPAEIEMREIFEYFCDLRSVKIFTKRVRFILQKNT